MTMDIVMPNETAAAIESRVSKVEAHIDALAEQMHGLSDGMIELTRTVRSQGESTSNQIQQLTVGMTRASGPRETNWGVLISVGGLLLAVIIAVGGMAVMPLQMRTSDAHFRLDHFEQKFEDHMKQPMHPAGEIRMNNMETSLKERAMSNTEAIKELDTKLQRENAIINGTIKERVTDLQRVIDDVKVNGSTLTRERLAVIEQQIAELRGTKK